MYRYDATKVKIRDILNSEGNRRLRADLKSGENDRFWLVNFSQFVYQIFALLLEMNIELSRQRILFFINHGFDVNTPLEYTNTFITAVPILRAAANRDVVTVKSLLQCGANPTIPDSDGMNIVEVCLIGSDVLHLIDFVSCEQIIHAVDKLKPVEEHFKIREWVVEIYCDEYKKESKYLNDVIRLCEEKDD